MRPLLERGEKAPTPKISALLGKRPVLRRATFVLPKARKRPYYGHFCGKMHREGSCSKAAGGPWGKFQMLNLVLGVGVFSLLPTSGTHSMHRNNQKGGTASLRSRTCVKRNAVSGARFKGLSLHFLYQKGNLIRIKTGLDTYLIRIQTRTPLVTVPPL